MDNYKIKDKKLIISIDYLVDLGCNRRTMENSISKFNKGNSIFFHAHKDPITNKKWIYYESIPKRLLKKFNISTDRDIALKTLREIEKNDIFKIRSEINLLLKIQWDNPIYWKQYIPNYVLYFLDAEKRNLFAKTHSIISCVIELKKSRNYKLCDIHTVYLKFENAVFWNESYNYFSKKILEAERMGIPDALVHGFKRFGRNNYRLNNFAKKRIIHYYCNPKAYSRKQIRDKVNLELTERGLNTISYNSVTLFMRNNEFRNKYDILRKGIEFGYNDLFPYLTRKEPQFIGELFQIDSTRLNIKYLSEDKKIQSLYLCVVMDVFTRKIIGYSFSDSENQVLIMESIRMAFKEFSIIPKQIVVDSHSSYSSEEFKKFINVMDEYGVDVRKSRPYNPRDKGHVERWFRTFSSSYLNQLMGNLGYGIKSKIADGRAAQSLERFYNKPSNLRTKKQLINAVSLLINTCNNDKKVVKKSKDASWLAPKRNFLKRDIAKIFFSQKRIKVRNSMVRMSVKGLVVTYTIQNIKKANQLNNEYVYVRYDEGNLNSIYLFDMKNGEYIWKLEIDERIAIVPNPEELVKIKKFSEKQNQRMQDQFDMVKRDLDEGKEELNSIPILQDFNSKKTKEEIYRQAEDDYLISEIINLNYPKDKGKRRMIRKKDKYKTNNTYNKVKNRMKNKNSIRIIED